LTFNPFTLQLDGAYPKGIYETLLEAASYGVPLYVTETGIEDPNDSGQSAAWLVQTLTWVKRAMQKGAPVRGYCYWTLMDNYEWSHGMGVRMGLYAVDKNDPAKVRHARSGAAVYGRIAQAGAIPPDLAERYPAR
jgi:beta-glucosidase/6-phospho-beta-glucosidase/beta-galactosidase